MTDAGVVPGLRVRHRDGWTGTIQRQGTPGVAEITPDGGSGPRWFYLAEFEPVDWDGGQLPERVPIRDWRGTTSQVPKPAGWDGAPVPTTSEAERRFMVDPGFHQLVTYLGQLLRMASYADLKDAADLAIQIDMRRRRDSDDVRGTGQNDATEGCRTDGDGQPEPGRQGAGTVSR